jgi:acetyltransferase-like isoleucine patch superfamily enzyme
MIAGLACVYAGVTLGDGVTIHPFAVVGHKPSSSPALARQPSPADETTIGARTVISPHAVIYAGVTIGEDCLIGDGASIREGTVIGDRCVIGRHVTLHHDVTLGDDVRLLDGTHLTGGCVVGSGSFFGPGCLTSNDKRIDLHNYAHHGVDPARFGQRVFVGTGANVLAGVTVGDDAVIGAGALVVQDVPAGSRVLGQRAQVR